MPERSPVEVEVAKAGLLGGGDALAGIPPLSPDGLAVIGSGQFGEGGQAGAGGVSRERLGGPRGAGEYAWRSTRRSRSTGSPCWPGSPRREQGSHRPTPTRAPSPRADNGQVLISSRSRSAVARWRSGCPLGGSSKGARAGRPLFGGTAGGPATVTSRCFGTPAAARPDSRPPASVVEAFVQAYTPDPVLGYVR